MPLPAPLKSSAAIRAASTEPMPLVSWKMPEMSLSTPTRTTSPDISARALPATQANASARPTPKPLIVSLPCVVPEPTCCRYRVGSSGRHDLDRQAVEPAQRVVEEAPWLSGDLDFGDAPRQRRHHHLAFEAGNELADTHVDAGAVADMAGGAAGDVVSVGLIPAARIAVGGGEKHQHLLAFGDCGAAEFDVAGGGAEEGLDRAFEPHGFLEGVTRQRRITAQPLELIGKAREAIDGGTDPVDGGIETRRQQRTHQQWRLGRGDGAVIDVGVDAGADAARGEIVALALLGNIGLVRRRALDRLLAELVRRTEGVEYQARVRQQMLAALRPQAQRIREDRQRIGFRKVLDRVETALLEQGIDAGLRGGGK